MSENLKGSAMEADVAVKIVSDNANKEGKTMEKMGFDFVSEMEGWLKARGFEEDEFAEGTGRTFRDAFQTVYFEDWDGRINVYVSNDNHGNPWDDERHYFLQLPAEEEVLKARGFQKFLLDTIEALEEDSSAY